MDLGQLNSPAAITMENRYMMHCGTFLWIAIVFCFDLIPGQASAEVSVDDYHGYRNIQNKESSDVHIAKRAVVGDDVFRSMAGVSRNIQRQEAEVMSELLKHFHWTYVNILVSDNYDDVILEEELVRRMQENGECVAYSAVVQDRAYEILLEDLLQRGMLTTLLLTTQEDTHGILRGTDLFMVLTGNQDKFPDGSMSIRCL